MVQVTQGTFNSGFACARGIVDKVLLHPTQLLLFQMAASSTSRGLCERLPVLTASNTVQQHKATSLPSFQIHQAAFVPSVSKHFTKHVALEQVTSSRTWRQTNQRRETTYLLTAYIKRGPHYSRRLECRPTTLDLLPHHLHSDLDKLCLT